MLHLVEYKNWRIVGKFLFFFFPTKVLQPIGDRTKFFTNESDEFYFSFSIFFFFFFNATGSSRLIGSKENTLEIEG